MKKIITFLFLTISLCVNSQTPIEIAQTFNVGSEFGNSVSKIALQSDGKILVGGKIKIYNGVSVNNLIRLNPDGTLDDSFSLGTGFNESIYAIAIQSDGKILVGGPFNTFNGSNVGSLVRLNTDGSLDNSFSTGVGFNNTVLTIVLQPDGKILVGGAFFAYNNSNANRITRLNSDGSIDTSFNNISEINDIVQTIAIQPDGRILVGGNFSISNGNGIPPLNYLIRLNTNGTRDYSFSGTEVKNYVKTIVLQPDGKILVGGSYPSFNTSTSKRLIRLNSNGYPDSTFKVGSGSFSSDSVNSIVLQSDGKIIVGGKFSIYNNVTANNLFRVNSDGSLDSTFDIGTGFDSQIDTMVQQANGDLLVGGLFSSYNGNSNSPHLVALSGDKALSNGVFEIDNALQLSPNPTTNSFIISGFSLPLKSVRIYDFQGKMVYQDENINAPIDIKQLNSGLYLVKISTETGEFTKKILKE